MSVSFSANATRIIALFGALAASSGAIPQAPVEKRAPAAPAQQNSPPARQDQPDLSVTPAPVGPANTADKQTYDIVKVITDSPDCFKAALALPVTGPDRERFIDSLSTIARRDKVEPLIMQAARVLKLAEKAFTTGAANQTAIDMIVFNSEVGRLYENEAIVAGAGGLPHIEMKPRIDGKPATLINNFLQLNDQGFVKLNEDEWNSLLKDAPVAERKNLADEAKTIMQAIFDNRLNSIAGHAIANPALRKQFSDAEKLLIIQEINGGLDQLGAAYRVAKSGYDHPNEPARNVFNYVLEQLSLIREKEIRDQILAPSMPRASLETPSDGLRSELGRNTLPVIKSVSYRE